MAYNERRLLASDTRDNVTASKLHSNKLAFQALKAKSYHTLYPPHCTAYPIISWDVKTCINAASNGHLELLKWARANQCPWSEETCAYAAQGGHFELLKWARMNECPWMYAHACMLPLMVTLKC